MSPRHMTIEQSLIPHSGVEVTRASGLTISIEFPKADQAGRGRIITRYINANAPLLGIVLPMEAYICRTH